MEIIDERSNHSHAFKRIETFDSEWLNHLLRSQELTFLMEAHDALSAVIVEESGFPGLWASGLSIASSLANEASWTQVVEVVEVVESMADVTHIPILVDGNSGFGNFNTPGSRRWRCGYSADDA